MNFNVTVLIVHQRLTTGGLVIHFGIAGISRQLFAGFLFIDLEEWHCSDGGCLRVVFIASFVQAQIYTNTRKRLHASWGANKTVSTIIALDSHHKDSKLLSSMIALLNDAVKLTHLVRKS